MDNILSILNNITSQGSFFSKLTVPTDNLQLDIKEVGKLKFPLTHSKAKSLTKVARPAKFGWKDKTLLDKAVRDVWEIPKSKVKIDKRTWNKTLNPLLENLQTELGLAENGKFKALLHNLLVYAPGQFFHPHQDTEKLDGMVATLVVILPCEHSGGELIIDHQGEKKRLKPSSSSSDQLTCIAFYADCHHEVKPVKSGYRVALTYNLILDNATEVTPPLGKSQTVSELTQALRSNFDQRLADLQSDEAPSFRVKVPPKWVYLLDHEYTPKGLSWKRLKNDDQLRVNYLKEAAKSLNLDCYLALADIQEIWSCESSYDDYYSRSRYGYRYNRYYDDDEDEEENDAEDSTEEDYQLIEMIDSSISLRHWRDIDNSSVEFSDLGVSGGEICWTIDTEDFDPFKSEYEGWMGNYGDTLDRWYHRAAIVLWRKEDHYAMLCQVAPQKAITEIYQLSKKATTRVQAQDIVEHILPYWSDHQSGEGGVSWSTTVFNLAIQLKSPSLAQSLLIPLELTALTPSTAPAFIILADEYGEPWCLNLLNSWSTSNTYRSSEMIKTLPSIINKWGKSQKNIPKIIDWIFNYQFTTLKDSFAYHKEHYSLVEMARQSPERISAILDLLKGCIADDNHMFYRKVLDYLIADKTLYSPLALADLLQKINKQISNKNNSNNIKNNWGHKKLNKYIVDELNVEINSLSRQEGDWSIHEKITCDCNDCEELSQFLRSSTERNKIWPIGKDRRAHIHRRIDGMGLPVSHETLRQGSPHKLVLNKTDQLLLQEKNQRKTIQKALTQLAK